MTLKEFNIDQLAKINFDESGIIGILWANDENDLNLLIDWCGQEDMANDFDFNNIATHLYFEFVTNVEFNFKFNEKNMKAIEISHFNYTIRPDSTYDIEFLFDFQPVGHMKFRCNDFKFVIDKK